MPLRYMIRKGMMGQSYTAPNLNLDSTYEDLVGLFRNNKNYIYTYYTDKTGTMHTLPLQGPNLSKTKFRNLIGYNENDPLTIVSK